MSKTTLHRLILLVVAAVVLAVSALFFLSQPPTSGAAGRPVPTARPARVVQTPSPITVTVAEVSTISEGVYRATLDGHWALLTARAGTTTRLEAGTWRQVTLDRLFIIRRGDG